MQATRSYVLKRERVTGPEADDCIGTDLLHYRLELLELCKDTIKLNDVSLVEIGDDVLAEPGCKDKRIVPVSAVDCVVPGANAYPIVTTAAENYIVAVPDSDD